MGLSELGCDTPINELDKLAHDLVQWRASEVEIMSLFVLSYKGISFLSSYAATRVVGHSHLR
jgi:hypothetical protein